MGSDSMEIMRGDDVIDVETAVDERLQRALVALGIMAIAAAIGTIVVVRPGLTEWSDAAIWFGCGLAIALGGASSMLGGSEMRRRVRFDGRARRLQAEIVTRFGVVGLEHLRLDDCERFGGVRAASGSWDLFVVDGRDGSRLRIAGFESEMAKRRMVAELARVGFDFSGR